MPTMLVEIAVSRCPPASGALLAAGAACTSATGRRGPAPGAVFACISVTPRRVGVVASAAGHCFACCFSLRMLSSLGARSANLAASKAQGTQPGSNQREEALGHDAPYRGRHSLALRTISESASRPQAPATALAGETRSLADCSP